jgi:catechol 2,3-dioxygenase-like lactoylglutathione lyase family enzyme
VQVAAPVGSEGEARAFYGDLLGLPELGKPEALRSRGGVWFVCGTHQLHVGVVDDFSPATKAHPALRVRPPTLDLIAERLAAAEASCSGMTRSQERGASTPVILGDRLELLAIG